MTAQLGMNLAGVERVFELESELERMAQRMAVLERRAAEVQVEMEAEIDKVRRSMRADLVLYEQPRLPARAKDVDL